MLKHIFKDAKNVFNRVHANYRINSALIHVILKDTIVKFMWPNKITHL